MENNRYIVSARKYRPTTFESVVGQHALTETLRNSIRQGKLAHAYLFCGPRGVGKTTCARIFAKTINCQNPTSTHDACNQCESCTAFNEQRSFNIHELDAASNNSVEDIRNLIDQVRIPPQIGKYSVYIIDEVHMLSAGAFNALLKTLEEPPSYAIFILATTEKHKVLPTILSRCQVYDFQRITVADIIHHLQYVAAQEGISATEDALNVVAQKADGGMRDALSIFDQLVAFCGDTLTYERAIEVLNVLDTEYYFRLTDMCLKSDVKGALLLLNEVLNKGFDAANFVSGFAKHLRDVLVAHDTATINLIETSDAIRQHYKQQAAYTPAVWIFKALDIIVDSETAYRTSKNKRLTVELMLIRKHYLHRRLLPKRLNRHRHHNRLRSQNLLKHSTHQTLKRSNHLTLNLLSLHRQRRRCRRYPTCRTSHPLELCQAKPVNLLSAQAGSTQITCSGVLPAVCLLSAKAVCQAKPVKIRSVTPLLRQTNLTARGLV